MKNASRIFCYISIDTQYTRNTHTKPEWLFLCCKWWWNEMKEKLLLDHLRLLLLLPLHSRLFTKLEEKRKKSAQREKEKNSTKKNRNQRNRTEKGIVLKTKTICWNIFCFLCNDFDFTLKFLLLWGTRTERNIHIFCHKRKQKTRKAKHIFAYLKTIIFSSFVCVWCGK